jgi:hypothetical protein
MPQDNATSDNATRDNEPSRDNEATRDALHDEGTRARNALTGLRGFGLVY